jgi:hypothetical protein
MSEQGEPLLLSDYFSPEPPSWRSLATCTGARQPSRQQLDPDGRPYPPPSRGDRDYPLVDFSFALDFIAPKN